MTRKIWPPSMQAFDLEMRRNNHWMKQGLCATEEYRDYVWFPTRKGMSISERTLHRQTLQRICNRCPVQAECHNFAETAGVSAGIWAGKYYGG